MKSFLIMLLTLIFFPVLLYADTLILRDGGEITTNYYWKEGFNRVGYFQDGTEKYINYNLVDWDAMANLKTERHMATRRNTERPQKQNEEKNNNVAPHHAKYRGYGDDIIRFSKPNKNGPAILVISGNKAEKHFSIMGYSDSGQRTGLLVNTTDSYNGTVLVDIAGNKTTSQLEIKAQSEWVILVYDIKYARKYKRPGRMEGKGDDVLIVLGSAGIMKVGGNSINNHFAMLAYSPSMGRRLLVNTTDQYSGRVRIPTEPFVMEINATGPWIVDTE